MINVKEKKVKLGRELRFGGGWVVCFIILDVVIRKVFIERVRFE